ncbi:igE-binding protein-like, partial [Cynocephalus volans]
LSDKVRKKVQAAFPVFEVEGGGRVHAPVEYTQIKDLAEAVRKYGVNANFTLVMLERFAGVAMTPADWQMLAKAALPTMGQYMEWKALWHEAAQAQARANAAALTPEQRDWTFDMLTGQGPFAADQTAFPWGAYVQVSSTAIKAWKALPQKGEASGQLTKIIQGPQEPFSDFVARMTEAAGRIFGDPDQAAPLVEQLIFEQATQECRAAIAP